MDSPGQRCVACLAPAMGAVTTRRGDPLCPRCAAQFYVACAGCGGLMPQDEAVMRDGVRCCLACPVNSPAEEMAEAVSAAEAPLAVVDQHCRVYGGTGLRVADASLMPDVIRANTNATTIMIAERVADFVCQGS